MSTSIRHLTRLTTALALAGLIAACGTSAPTESTTAPTPELEAAASKSGQATKPGVAPAPTALFAEQNANWQSCGLPFMPSAQCGTLQAPLDWYAPSAGRVNVAVLRVPASEPARRRGILLVNPGGPGGPGALMAAYIAMAAPELAKVYDIVGFDPRGVGNSTNLNCVLDVDFTKPYTTQDIARLIASDCRKQPLSAHVNTEQTVRDMDLIRAVLGETKTNYLGYSYGTWLGAWYAARFPERTDRFVLDSSTDLHATSLQNTFELQPMARERAVSEGFFPWLARSVQAESLPYTSDMPRNASDLRARYEQFPHEVQAIVQSIIIRALYNPGFFPAAAMMFDAANALTSGDAATVTADMVRAEAERRAMAGHVPDDVRGELLDGIRAARATRGSLEAFQLDASSSTFYAVTCNDGRFTPSGSYWQQFGERAARQWPFVGAMYAMQPCAYWPATWSFPDVRNTSFPPVLIVQSEMDSATPYEGARRARQYLPGSRMVTVDNEFAHAIYPYGDTCVDATVEAYLIDGRMPGADVACAAQPLPLETSVYEVGGRIGGHGKLQGLKEHGPAVRAARALVKNIIRSTAQQGDPVR